MNKKRRIFLYVIITTVVVFSATAAYIGFNRADHFASPLNQALSLYQKGDYKRAMTYFTKADKAGIPEATFALGSMHFTGLGTSVDIPKALSYYHKAADANYAPAQTTLAFLYIDGKYVAKDPEAAVNFALKAAENNDTEAQMILARWFENGEYVRRDMNEAIRFYTMAAKNGNMNAKIALTVIYKDRKGNIVAAKKWEESIQKQKRFENIFRNLPPDYIEKALP